ncbi:uncharacterized protein LOC117483875 [Trematomus bernacchii]|uniref:uncharacterized protein LOC117483875 n=1 Tax=Trematomus bernacchii TaxID=40690 RepID=UPI00146A1F59|nr:uncharacterized protein LOC117483875 [Trematomus bernacchii]
MQSLITKIATGKMSTYAAIISIFTFTILLDRDFSCSCKPQVPTCNLYMYLPPFIIFLLMLLADRSFQRVCRYYCSHCKCSCSPCWFLIQHILRAFLVALLWVAFLYLDGDWYVCCKNDGSEQQAKLACKAEKDITLNDTGLKAELKNSSRRIGGWIISGIVLGAFVLPLLVRWKCCGKEFLYDKLIMMEEGKLLKEVLRNSAKERLTEGMSKISVNEWEKCFDFARQLIDKDPPDLPVKPRPLPTTAGPEVNPDRLKPLIKDDAVQDDAG